MAQLYKINPNGPSATVIPNLELAESFWQRAKGLLGRNHLDSDQGLWIKPCNNIHTFFMKFKFDCVFIDRQMKVVKTFSSLKSFKIIGPFWKASSVLELPEGTIEKFKILEGDQLYVVH